MSLRDSTFRGLYVFGSCLVIVYIGIAIISAFLLPPAVLSSIIVLVASFVGAVMGAGYTRYRSKPPDRLGQFALAVFGLAVIVGFPVNLLYQRITEYGSPIAWLLTLILLGSIYGGGYSLVYTGAFQRLKNEFGESTGKA